MTKADYAKHLKYWKPRIKAAKHAFHNGQTSWNEYQKVVQEAKKALDAA